MDTIEFRPLPDPNTSSVHRVRVVINDRDLAELARVVELPYAERAGSPSIAGAYTGLDSSDALPPSQLFFGSPASRLYLYGTQVQVLGCECGEPGCWPLVCSITSEGDTIVWSGFSQPHRRSGSAAGEWRHDGLGPFRFDRSDYERALQRAVLLAAG